MNVIAFSLFGSSPLYTHGMIANAVQYPQIFGPDWKVMIWCSEIPKEIVLKLTQAGAIIKQPPKSYANRMFDRFLAMDDPANERILFRDADSRPTQREHLAVKEWMAGRRPFHCMSDHPHHTLPLGGGLWGIDKTKIKGEMPYVLAHVEEAIIRSRLAPRAYTRARDYSLDQTFLTSMIYPLAKRMGLLRHDSCTRHLFGYGVPFPTGCKVGDDRFAGEVFGTDDKPHALHYQMRYNYMTT